MKYLGGEIKPSMEDLKFQYVTGQARSTPPTLLQIYEDLS